ncbi:MAG TPA: tRNA (guanosine(46)-N7)-methyltransferase TrmB [Geopsychrobacteraceae bacterium]|nr:tRNA (guanosine(46)-N7)-methyltransferase TrmB [Geopsychrobacteraceae bacterium]
MRLITSPSFLPEAKAEEVGNVTSFFEKEQPLSLEIGCGIGDFIVQLAARHPQRNFVVTDIYNQGCLKTCARVDDAGLTNVRVMRSEARYLMTHLLGAESLQAIYINCPDPWPKKRHRKRRMVNQEFLQLAFHTLQADGEFHFSTDFVDYGISVGELLKAEPGFKNLQSTPYSHDLGDYPVSKYMRRFLEQGQPIYYCRFLRRADYKLQTPPAIGRGFRSRWVGRSER